MLLAVRRHHTYRMYKFQLNHWEAINAPIFCCDVQQFTPRNITSIHTSSSALKKKKKKSQLKHAISLTSLSHARSCCIQPCLGHGSRVGARSYMIKIFVAENRLCITIHH